MLTFRPVCTLSSDTVNYVYPANTRGTLDIVWACLSILILCLWNVIHINVRAPLYPSQAWSKPWILGKARTLGLKIQWMAVAFFAPEILIAKALHDRIIVGESVKEIQKFAAADSVRWTATHAHFANMGAFVIRFPPLTSPICDVGISETAVAIVAKSTDTCGPIVTNGSKTNVLAKSERPILSATETMTVDEQAELESSETAPSAQKPVKISAPKKVASIAQRELVDSFGRSLKTISPKYGKEVWRKDKINAERAHTALESLEKTGILSTRLRNRQRNVLALQGDLWILDAAQIRVARACEKDDGPLIRLPDIHEEHLESESRSDALLKILTIIQVAWMVIQLLVRVCRHLPSSQLELVTFAFAICSIITYIALLEKPKDVALTKTLQALRYPTADELLDIALAGPSTLFRFRAGYWIPGNSIHHFGSSSVFNASGLSIRQKVEKLDANASYSRVVFILTGCIGATLFGSLHLISWNFHFPTPIERLLWRVAICVTIGFPLIGAVAQGLFAQIFQSRTRKPDKHGDAEQYQRSYLRITASLIGVVGICYSFVRLFVLVEVFRSLAYLEPDTYKTTWAVSVPHIG